MPNNASSINGFSSKVTVICAMQMRPADYFGRAAFYESLRLHVAKDLRDDAQVVINP